MYFNVLFFRSLKKNTGYFKRRRRDGERNNVDTLIKVDKDVDDDDDDDNDDEVNFDDEDGDEVGVPTDRSGFHNFLVFHPFFLSI